MPLLIDSLGGCETSGICVQEAETYTSSPAEIDYPQPGSPESVCACRGSRVWVPEVLSRLRDTCLTRESVTAENP